MYKKQNPQKVLLFLFILIILYEYNNKLNNIKLKININKINIAIFANSIKNGGAERQTTLILNNFCKVRMFNLYLFTIKNKEKDEYIIDKSIKRIIIKNNLIQVLKQNNIDILIYQFYIAKEIVELNKLNKTKTIFINRSCFLHWIYYELYYFFKTVYKAYKKSRYVISLIPFENDYLFKRWGINSILMNNFIPYEPNHVKPSDLSSKTILMIGRGGDPIKRFELGIYTMKYIVREIPDCEMKIICNTDTIYNLKNLVFKLNLNNCIKFVGYTPNPDNFYKNASMHLFMTKAEAFPNILSETLSYGIPNILAGLDYVSTAKGGTIIIYDDSPISIASIAIKILRNRRYRKHLGKEARKNMKRFKNDLLLEKWINIILSIYKGDKYYEELRNKDIKLSEDESLRILKNQIELLRLRKKEFKNITIKDIENITFMENLENYIKK